MVGWNTTSDLYCNHVAIVIYERVINPASSSEAKAKTAARAENYDGNVRCILKHTFTIVNYEHKTFKL